MAKKPKHFARREYGYNSLVQKAKKEPISIKSIWHDLNKARDYRVNIAPLHSRKIQLGIIALVMGFIIFMGAVSPNLPEAHADYNSSFSHTRTVIYSETGNWDSSRWNFNSTCVQFTTAHMNFTYSSGTTGSGGNNCSSADIAINKSPISLATTAGKQLEMSEEAFLHFASGCSGGSCFKRLMLILRTNGTLPTFTENYDPFGDKTVRMILDQCPSYDVSLCGANGGTGPYIAHGEGNSITQEGLTNDIAFSTQMGGEVTPYQVQLVMNFTGGPNFIAYKPAAGVATSGATGIGAPLQQGQDVYIMFVAQFITSVAPCTCSIDVQTGGAIIPSGPAAFGVWTTPASCEDRLNIGNAVCSVAAPAGYSLPSTSKLNLFDPTSWIVYLGKVTIWAWQQALGLILQGGVYFVGLMKPIIGALATIVFGFMKVVLNAVGNVFGISNLGDNIFTLLGDFAAWFTGPNSVFSQVIAFIASVVTDALNTLTALGNILTSYYTALSGWWSALGDFLTGFWTVGNLMIGIPISLLFSGWILYGVISFSDDLEKGMAWYDLTGRFMLLGVGITWYFIIILINYIVIPLAQVIMAIADSINAAKPPGGAAE